MERVAFLLESGQRLGCLLNPQSLLVRRVAGVRPRRSARGSLSGAGLMDQPLLYTGGGTTDLRLDLLFDVTVSGSSVVTDDVRMLTGPLWRMSENAAREQGYGRLPRVTFVWGKAWNISGVVAAIAEKLEYFAPEGAPRRSWVRMRMLRVMEPEAAAQPVAPLGGGEELPEELFPRMPGEPERPLGDFPTHPIVGGGDDRGEGVGQRLDEVAQEHYGDPSYWRLLAAFNGILDPMHLEPGTVIQIPPLSVLSG